MELETKEKKKDNKQKKNTTFFILCENFLTSNYYDNWW